MRALGLQHLIASCLNDACRHSAQTRLRRLRCLGSVLPLQAIQQLP
jgi:hypothetical protein